MPSWEDPADNDIDWLYVEVDRDAPIVVCRHGRSQSVGSPAQSWFGFSASTLTVNHGPVSSPPADGPVTVSLISPMVAG